MIPTEKCASSLIVTLVYEGSLFSKYGIYQKTDNLTLIMNYHSTVGSKLYRGGGGGAWQRKLFQMHYFLRIQKPFSRKVGAHAPLPQPPSSYGTGTIILHRHVLMTKERHQYGTTFFCDKVLITTRNSYTACLPPSPFAIISPQFSLPPLWVNTTLPLTLVYNHRRLR